MPVYDAKCDTCEHEFEERRKSQDEVGHCPICGNTAHTIWTMVPILDKAKDPYDLLDGRIPDSRPIKSFANDKRRGGKNTV